MKIKSITIKGFRGFNEEQTINFHDKLTLIYAPNSYGKTSISEALEWLLYGKTSRLEKADSKEEYKGSYRNCHFPEPLTPSVKATFINEKSEIEFSAELTEEEDYRRFVNGKEFDDWPFAQDITAIPRPFILQHALKYLILAKPDERFQGFARLLGLEELDKIQKNIVSLCTKAEADLPTDVVQFMDSANTIKASLDSQPSFNKIAKIMKSDIPDKAEVYKLILEECRKRVPLGTDESSFLPQLLKIREDSIKKIFEGHIVLLNYSEEEKQANSVDEEFLIRFFTESFVKKYLDLSALNTVQQVLDRAQFLSLGVCFLDKTPEICPFCGQKIDCNLYQYILEQNKNLSEEKKCNEILQNEREGLLVSLTSLKQKLESYQKVHVEKVKSFLELKPSLSQLEKILAPKHETHFQAVKNAISQIERSKEKLETSSEKVLKMLKKIENSVTESKEDTKLIKLVGETLTDYIAKTRDFAQMVLNNVPSMYEAEQILKHELDSLAGTEDISILVNLLEKRNNIEKSLEIQYIIEGGFKDFRKTVDQYIANKIFNAISEELSSDVAKWYGLIKTTGDPDVHFDGFDMERTKTGDLRARRIQIKARSYGIDMVSAVSSLSESKLNALGLCVSIATNMKGNSPFDFLIIDDPIQSWDAEHETKFIEVIRKLVEYGKQVVLLSHNSRWLNELRSGCRSLNGWFYEITGYTKTGPHISEIPWEQWKKRLEEVDAILKDSSASSVKLQQAEEEIRIAITDITSKIYFKVKGAYKSSHDLNSDKVRKILIECGVKPDLVDHIVQTFQTTDDAHHASDNYSPNREKIREYHSWVFELGNLLK